MPEALAYEEPCAVGDETSGKAKQERLGEADLPLSRERSRGQQHRCRRQRQAQLLHKDPDKEQEIAVGKENMRGECHAVLRQVTSGWKTSRLAL